MTKQEKKRMRTMDIILAISGLIMLVYTTIVLIIFARTGLEPTTLTCSLFAALTGEAGVMGWIKNAKLKLEITKNKSDISSVKILTDEIKENPPQYTEEELEKGGGAL